MVPGIHNLIREHAEAVARLESQSQPIIADSARLLIDCLAGGGSIFVCGNGGSAADAQHIAGELAGRFQRERRGLPCTALCTDSSVMTAVGNDYSFDKIFARQIEAHLRSGDVLWVLSTSGNSPNVLEAIKTAREHGGKILGFTGGQGGKLRDLCDVCFIAPAQKAYAVQQLHQIAYHIVCELVDQASDKFIRRSGPVNP